VTSILSSISGYFSRSIILGTFLPVTIFVVLSLILLVPALPAGVSISELLVGLDTGTIVGISFLTIVLSGLLYNMNIPILRLYEGYPWRRSWIGSWLTRRHVARFEATQLRLEGMRAVLRKMESVDKELTSNSDFVKEVLENWRSLGSPLQRTNLKDRAWLKTWHLLRAANQPDQDPQVASELDQMGDLWRALSTDLRSEFSTYRIELKHAYPDKRGLILPTRLGNVIRSFEYYSDREYGIDSVEIWPRLVSVIPTDYAVTIDDTKTTFDFMMNCSLLSAVLAMAVFIVGLLYPSSLVSPSDRLYWLVKIGGLISLSYFFYRLSINRADAWGLLIKAAFDLFRWELLKKLGYEQSLVTREEEREHWREISRQAIYGDRFNKKLMPYATPDSFPSANMPKTELTRGVNRDVRTDVMTVYLRVKNKDAKSALKGVTVSDLLSDDLDFQWDSAKLDGESVNVSGTNPYEFTIGEIARGAEAILTYQAIPKKSSRFSVSLN
jgi:hypothetical protein